MKVPVLGGSAKGEKSVTMQYARFLEREEGLGAVWTTVFPANVGAVRSLLGVPDTVVPLSCIPLGRPAGSIPRTESRFNETKVHRQASGGR